MNQQKSVLILGATGGIGGAIAARLVDRGWHVRALARDPDAARALPLSGIEWVGGDAMNREDVIGAATGVSAVVHAVNPPGYRNWDKVVLPMIDNTIAAARSAGGARIVLPGTIYNFDPASAPVIGAETAQLARSRKGRIRVEMERRLAAAAPEVPSLILRAGDFFGPGARASWFGQAMIKPGKPVRRVVNPAGGPGHSWAYLPDLAETFARLMDIEDRLAPCERVQFEGLYDESGTALTDGIARVVGDRLPVWRFPWWLMRALAPFGGFPREAAEMVGYWRHPARLDNTRLVKLIGREPRTGLDTAIYESLAAAGCLDKGAGRPQGALA